MASCCQSRFSIHFCHLSRFSQSAILVLVWDALMYNFIIFMRCYKIIVTGIYLCFFAWILSGVDSIIAAYWSNNLLFSVIYAIGYLCAVVGYTAFRANIIQFNIDQLVGASADQLSAIIYWHSINVPVVFTIFKLGRCSFNFFLYYHS